MITKRVRTEQATVGYSEARKNGSTGRPFVMGVTAGRAALENCVGGGAKSIAPTPPSRTSSFISVYNFFSLSHISHRHKKDQLGGYIPLKSPTELFRTGVFSGAYRNEEIFTTGSFAGTERANIARDKKVAKLPDVTPPLTLAELDRYGSPRGTIPTLPTSSRRGTRQLLYAETRLGEMLAAVPDFHSSGKGTMNRKELLKAAERKYVGAIEGTNVPKQEKSLPAGIDKNIESSGRGTIEKKKASSGGGTRSLPEARLGEMLAAMPAKRHGCGSRGGTSPTLPADIDKRQSHKAQKLSRNKGEMLAAIDNSESRLRGSSKGTTVKTTLPTGIDGEANDD